MLSSLPGAAASRAAGSLGSNYHLILRDNAPQELKHHIIDNVIITSGAAVAELQRRQWGYYQLHLLGEVAAGVIPRSVQWDEEAKSKKKESSNIVQEVINARPPLVMTSQGRVQTLPSRFNDLVLDNWKKENSKATTIQRTLAIECLRVPTGGGGGRGNLRSAEAVGLRLLAVEVSMDVADCFIFYSFVL
nr:Histone-lysine N-methyltransferase ATX5 [Ipomoea batatas]